MEHCRDEINIPLNGKISGELKNSMLINTIYKRKVKDTDAWKHTEIVLICICLTEFPFNSHLRILHRDKNL
ncbi:hypothetical protein E2320_019979 [Naja naja]|nr:hypothetical protein E2320_019979 [Naja naja]